MNEQSDEKYRDDLKKLSEQRLLNDYLHEISDFNSPLRPQIGDIIFIRNDKLSQLAQAIVRRKKTAFSHVYLCVSPDQYIHATPDEYSKNDDFNAQKNDGDGDKKQNKNATKTGVFLITETQFWQDIKKAIADCDKEKKPLSEPVWKVRRNKIISSNKLLQEVFTEKAKYYLDQKYNWTFFLIEFLGKASQLSQSFCSELAAKIYQDTGMSIIESTTANNILPIDIFDVTNDISQWEDVTDVYDKFFSVRMSGIQDETTRKLKKIMAWQDDIGEWVRKIGVENALSKPQRTKITEKYGNVIGEAFEQGIISEEDIPRFIPPSIFDINSLKSWYNQALSCLKLIDIPQPPDINHWSIDKAKLKNLELYAESDWDSIQKKLHEQSAHIINQQTEILNACAVALLTYSELVMKMIRWLQIGRSIGHIQSSFEECVISIKKSLQGVNGFDNYENELNELDETVFIHIINPENKDSPAVSERYKAIYQQIRWRKELQISPIHQIISQPLREIKIEMALAAYFSALKLCPLMTIES